MRHFGDHIGGGRGDEDQIRLFRQRHMGHVILEIPGKGIHHAAVVGQGFKGQGSDELRGVFRHDHMNLRPRFSQTAGHIGHFIGGNAAADAQKDAFSLQIHPKYLL